MDATIATWISKCRTCSPNKTYSSWPGNAALAMLIGRNYGLHIDVQLIYMSNGCKRKYLHVKCWVGKFKHISHFSYFSDVMLNRAMMSLSPNTGHIDRRSQRLKSTQRIQSYYNQIKEKTKVGRRLPPLCFWYTQIPGNIRNATGL